MAALYLTVFSIGEAFYSPRVYEYAAAIAPKGQEASYGSLAYLPFLVGKILVGAGGWLLAAFCPEHGSAALRNNVVYLCSGGIGRADRVDCACVATFASPKPVGPINRKNGNRTKLDACKKVPSHFLACLRIQLKKIDLAPASICQRKRSCVDWLALSENVREANGLKGADKFRV